MATAGETGVQPLPNGPRPQYYLLGLAAIAAAVVAAPEEKDDASTTRVGEFSMELGAETAVLIAVSAIGILGMIALAMLLNRVRFSMLLCSVVCASLLTVGVASWAVSYSILHSVLQERVEQVIDRTARVPQMYLTSELRQAAAAVRSLAASVAVDHTNLTNEWPRSHLMLAAAFSSLVFSSDTAELLYYAVPGNGDNRSAAGPSVVGVGRQWSSPEGEYPWVPRNYHLGVQFDARNVAPSYIACRAHDRVAAGSTECVGYACGTDADRDFLCQATCAGQPNLRYNSPASPEPAVFPLSSHRYCANVEGRETRLYTKIYAEFDQTKGQFTLANPDTAQDLVTRPYDPTRRPWYTRSRTPIFFDPYTYVYGSVGMTIAQGAYNSAGQFMGCVAMDVSLATMRPALLSVRPSNATDLFVVDQAGNLIGTSLTVEELSADTGFGSGTVVSLPGIARDRGSRTLAAFCPILDVYNASDVRAALAAMALRYTIVHAARGMHVSYPIDAGYNRYMLVVNVPLDDMLREMNVASVSSLAATLVITTCCCMIVFAIVTLLTGPLTVFSVRLEAVSHMDLAQPELPPSRVVELQTMVDSYNLMVQQLMEYREYLPQSVLLVSDDGFSADAAADAHLPDESQPTTASVGVLSPCSTAPLDSPSMVKSFSMAPPEAADSHATTDASPHGRRLSNPLAAATKGASAFRHPQPRVPPKTSSSPTSPAESTTSSCHSTAGGVRPTKFVVGVVDKRMSLISTIIHGIKETVAREPWIATNAHALALEHVVACIVRNRGIMEGFHGDVVHGSFNASKSVTDHRTNALVAAAAVRDGNRTTSQLTCAVACGRCSVGNMGCAGIKKFNILGAVPEVINKYARLAVQWGVSVIASAEMFDETGGFGFDHRRVYLVQRGGAFTMLCEVLNALKLEMEEWMYQLEQLNASPYRRLDRVIDILFNGQVDDALESVNELVKSLNDRDGNEDEATPSVLAHVDAVRSWAAALQAAGRTPSPLVLDYPQLPQEAACLVQERQDPMAMSVSLPSPYRPQSRASAGASTASSGSIVYIS